MLPALLAYLDQQQESVIRWQREMTSRPALGPENGGQGEEEKAAWLRDELARLGIPHIFRHDCPDERVACGFRPNISARVPGKSARTLWVVGHMDVVPPGEAAMWHGLPYDLRVDGDYIFGRGVEDNQQAIVTAMLAAEALVKHQATPDLSLGLLFVADEETGMSRGLPHVLASSPELFREDDIFLVPDMGNSQGNMVEIAEKSCLWLRFIVTGRQCHASTPEEGINSLIAASACILELESLYRIFRNKNTLYSPAWSTFVPSKKEANVENINTLPGQDVFYLDCRVLPEYDIDHVAREAEKIARGVAGRYRAQVTMEIVHKEQAPPPTPDNSPAVLLLTRILREQRGLEPNLCGVGGQTVAACLRHKGLDTVVWGTLMPNPHSPNECSRISATIADAKVILGMLCGTGI